MTTSREQTWEGRVWTLAQVLMSAAIIWSSSTLWDLSQTVTRIEERLRYTMDQQSLMMSTQIARDAVQDKRLDDLRREVSEIQGYTSERGYRK